MVTPTDTVVLPSRDLYGSRLRCLLLTHQPRDAVARLLTELVHPYATVSPSDRWMPRGFLQPAEAKLGEAKAFLSEENREAVTAWWLARRGRANTPPNTPNWDIACTADIEGRRGLVLVEAKAHSTEMKKDGKNLGDPENEVRIRAAIQQANEGLNGLEAGWNLAADSHYQLCNRFAWAWKVASLGVPVVLVYLGFLNAEEMARRGQPFRTAKEWTDALRSHAQGLVPDSAWDKRLEVEGTPLRVLIRAMDLRWVATGC